MLRVTRPYLNLLAKPRIFFRLSGKIYNFMHFERRNAFQNAKIIYFQRQNAFQNAKIIYFFQKK